MAKYAYAPLSMEENRRRREDSSNEDPVHERMPMCVGVCVLLAIVYVLSRTGGANVPAAPVPNVRGDNATVSTVPVSTATVATSKVDCPKCENGLSGLDEAELMGELRKKALANTPPNIIECAKAKRGESQTACHLPSEERYEAVEQKGATLWMTGCSGAGKTTIATLLEDKLVKMYGKHVYRLDGDNLRTGLNRDLTFTENDRAESVRRTGELSLLFSDAGIITLVGLISPYREDRDLVRQRHKDSDIPFYEIFLDVPIDELKKRDPKGQYAKVAAGKLKHFTCIDDPYEEPLNPEITLPTHNLTPQQSVDILFRRLVQDGILDGAPKLTPPGLPNPDGDQLVDLLVSPALLPDRIKEASTLPKVLINDIDLNWLQVIAEGWASPLTGFMREGTLLQTLHFNSILTDPFNLTENALSHESPTDFDHFPSRQPPKRVSMSIPITLAITDFEQQIIQETKTKAVALTTQMGKTMAILRYPETYPNRKEEIISRMYGAMDPGHPYIKHILLGGDYLLGGEIELLERIKYNDGLDQWRKTATELMHEFESKGADTVYAFQTRNPTHAGHAYLMRSAGQDLKSQGYNNPVLWLSPLGGWTKPDDVPLDVRIRQHEEVLQSGTSHPGGLDPQTTVMAIWPAPMVYAGPTEVQFHAKSRRSAGASYFVVGRDPAGIPRSDSGEDMWDGDHGRYVLQNSPGIGDMKMLSFVKVMYDISDNVMKEPDPDRPDDFISISGTKMRLLAKNGAVPCSPDHIPTDLVAANCIPSGFMVPKGWDVVVDYYKHIDQPQKFIPWSQPRVDPPIAPDTKPTGTFGTTSFQLYHNKYPSLWHDVPLSPQDAQTNVINFITEIPMFVAAKMEISKKDPQNPIIQDQNDDGTPRYYTYGVPFFNYGLVPQTWEDPDNKGLGEEQGDNDPLDVIELGSNPLKMGSITPCRIIGSFQLIDQGETDFKILCISLSDPDADRIHSMQDFEYAKPGYMAKLTQWFKRYKTSDGKEENTLASEEFGSVEKSMEIVQDMHLRWRALCGKRRLEYSIYGGAGVVEDWDRNGDKEVGEEKSLGSYLEYGFWLDSKMCRG